MTPDEIDTYIADRWEVARKASTEAARGILLWLAVAAREQFPNATGIRIGPSDQGDFMDFEAVLDADGNILDDDDDEFPEETRCWGLDDHNQSAWEPFCTETERSRRRNPQYVIDIDKALTEITLQKEGA